MTHTISRIALVLVLLVPGAALARAPQDETNVNTRYKVESVSIAGVQESRVSQALRDDMQKLVGTQYKPEATDDLAERLRQELHHYTVAVKVKRGDQPDHVKVVFEATRVYERTFEVAMSPLLYTTTDGFSATLVPGFETHHNYFSFGFTSSADELLERNEGVLLRYEHRKVGTDEAAGRPRVRLLPPVVPARDRERAGVQPAGARHLPDARALRPVDLGAADPRHQADVRRQLPDAWRCSTRRRTTRRPTRSPSPRSSAARSGRRSASATRSAPTTPCARRRPGSRATSSTPGSSSPPTTRVVHRPPPRVRRSTSRAGTSAAQPLLFERFSLGNSMTLRGWDKFDVAPVGGTRLAYGSLEYRYRPFLLFYDFGTVWDAGPGRRREAQRRVRVRRGGTASSCRSGSRSATTA